MDNRDTTASESARAPVPADGDRAAVTNSMWTHVLPFGAWLLMLALTSVPSAPAYAARTVVGLALFLWCAPWRWYPRPRWRNLPLALLVGALVFVIWVGPEAAWTQRFPGFQRAYNLLGILPPWKVAEPLTASPYTPDVCGWWLTATRMFGATVVVALIEEFFWRGFLPRWLRGDNFLRFDLGVYRAGPFFITAVFFGLEHDRWFVGILAGLLYGWLVVRTRDIWAAVIAHGLTNYLLGWYVLASGAYGLW
ncbi:MAG: CAAX prenyl protease-related protein [Candidatus Marinimicrobia bacterium]|nr:CAAX prenyl protease-related protein [Candidatus Neomarinimicrobiota bacterium]